MRTSWKWGFLLVGATLASGCALLAPPPPPVRGGAVAEGSVLGGAELARIRCLLVAPFENTSNLSKLGEVATNAMLASVDPELVRIFPVADLRELFKDSVLELPADGVSPRLALALAERVGADGVLYGVIEGRAQGSATDFLVTVRLQAAGGRELLFASASPVRAAPGESVEVALRRTLLLSTRSLLLKIGSPGPKSCFDPEIVKRAKELRSRPASAPPPASGPPPSSVLAEALAPLSAAPPPPDATPPATPEPAAAVPAALAAVTTVAKATSPTEPPVPKEPALKGEGVSSGPAPSVSPTLRVTPAPKKRAAFMTQRQMLWAKNLGERTRFVVEDVEFAGRGAALVSDKGLVDLAKAIVANPDLGIRLEVFVDATEDPSEDTQASMAMAMAATRRLTALGVDRERVLVEARGGESPLQPNFSQRGKVANRRIEVEGIPAP